MKPTNTETVTVRLWVELDENLIIDTSSYAMRIGFLYLRIFAGLLDSRYGTKSSAHR
jgi:hypothetical protein